MVTIELPPELVSRRIAPTFHASLVRPYVSNDSQRFPQREAKSFYDFGNDDKQEWLVDEIIAHSVWVSNKELEFQVLWTLGDITWEPYTTCKDLEALDVYLELRGVVISVFISVVLEPDPIQDESRLSRILGPDPHPRPSRRFPCPDNPTLISDSGSAVLRTSVDPIPDPLSGLVTFGVRSPFSTPHCI
jgi:hypothetical protein